MKVELAPRARIDLMEIGDYLERVAGRQIALRWIKRLEARARALGAAPFAGAEVPDLGGRRRVVVRPYLIIYVVEPSSVVRVVRVVHGARDVPALFDEG